MLVLGIETSCDETGVALYHSADGLLAHTLHSQVEVHALYGGVVPELASRDHIRRLLPLIQQTLKSAQRSLHEVQAIAYTEGPGLAGALLVGASIACSLAYALKIPALGIHHLEGHLLSPLLESEPPQFPFVALLVSGGHTQLMRVEGIGRYELLGDTLDDAAGEAFDKAAKLLGLGYPGGPALSKLATHGRPGHYKLPKPMLHSGDLNFSFSGLKTAVSTLVNSQALTQQNKADIAYTFQEAVVDVLVGKSIEAMAQTQLQRLVVSGGVGANLLLRNKLYEMCTQKNVRVFYPRLEFCTDNGAMIALAGALRLASRAPSTLNFTVRPRWNLEALEAIAVV